MADAKRGCAMNPSVAAQHLGLPLVSPQCLFAAGKAVFDVRVRAASSNPKWVKAQIFAHLPLEDHGWDFSKAAVKYLGTLSNGDRVWRVERKSISSPVQEVKAVKSCGGLPPQAPQPTTMASAGPHSKSGGG